ncbi:MAG: sigma-70 family RNA polymerase sigma factor [Clostridia bacterium]|nr:sigma-70 family RNA polymerase sigma factor [Clostridia bacterium]
MIFLSLSAPPGDKEKLETIYIRYSAKMYSAAYRILGSQSDAEDAVQNAFLNISRNLNKFNINDDHAMRGYVMTAAVNEAYNVIRGRKDAVPLEEAEDIPDGGDTELKVAEGAEFSAAVDAMRRLDDTYRAPLYLRYVMGYSLKETAKELKRNEATVRTQINRGIRLLKKALKEAGYES